MDIDDQTLEKFKNEFEELQKKYGIYVIADHEEQIDYNWNEEPYVSGIQSFLTYRDSEDNIIDSDGVFN